jgi:predicted flap endonuclease-1-like 5' DNA nuclease
MRAFKVFIFGLLYGWVIKIAFDRIYRQNDIEDIRNENISLKEYIHSLEAQVRQRSMESRSVQQMQQTEPEAAPRPAETLISPPAPQPTDLPEAMPTIQAPAEPFDVPAEAPSGERATPSLGASEGDRDDLKIIKGIGPAIERKLNNAGIYTFAALAQLSPKQLEEILGGQARRLQDENDLIMQAVRLVQNTPGEE